MFQGSGIGKEGFDLRDPKLSVTPEGKLMVTIGGPDFIVLNDDHLIAGGRTHYVASAPKTTLFTGKNNGHFVESIILPSGGDTSYPDFLVLGNELWVSYYSTHETPNASIYLAKIPLELFKW